MSKQSSVVVVVVTLIAAVLTINLPAVSAQTILTKPGFAVTGVLEGLPESGLAVPSASPALALLVTSRDRDAATAVPVWFTDTTSVALVGSGSPALVRNGDVVSVRLLLVNGVFVAGTLSEAPTLSFEGIVSSLTQPDGTPGLTITWRTGNRDETGSVAVATDVTTYQLAIPGQFVKTRPIASGDTVFIRAAVANGVIHATEIACPFCLSFDLGLPVLPSPK